MDFVVESLSKWPAPLVTALFCGAGGLLGSLVVATISRIVPLNKTVAAAIVTGFVVLGLKIPDVTIFKARSADPVRYALDEMKKIHFFEVLFRAHPEAEALYRDELKKLAVDDFDEAKQSQLRVFSTKLSSKYVNAHLLISSDQMLFKYLKSNLMTIESFRTRPDVCFAYYKANGQVPPTAATPKLMEDDLNLKADIIESSLSNPSPPREPVSQEEITRLYIEAYKTSGADIRDLPKITGSAEISPEEGCRIAIEAYKAVVSLGEQKGARLFRGLLEP
jgi:hypothetical protein